MKLNRREFLKSSVVVLGAATVSKEISSLFSQKGSVAEATGSTAVYEIYALKYAGPLRRKLAVSLSQTGWDEEIDINMYLWAIKGKEEFILVDTGGSPSLAAKRQLKNYVNPLDILARIGANSQNVNKVIITHLHWDHVGGVETFPKAFPKTTLYLQEIEFNFWLKDPMAKRNPFFRTWDGPAFKAFAALEGTDRLVLVRGDQEIMPGIELLLTPGHTIGLQSVAVNTAKGTAIVASDCAHIARSFKDDNPSSLITDLVAWMKSYDKLRAKASSIDLIFPGHDALMLTNYPKVAEDVTRLV